LTVVTAPAGWGKTTLLSQWAHDPGDPRPVAWVSLDESDDESVRFWTYVLMALQTLGLGAGSLAVLGGQGADPVDLAVPMLLNELESTTGQVVLVLDDYHALTDPGVHESVEFLLAYLPASLRLVLAGRFDPPLALARMRARGDLTEVRVSDLVFSSGEAGALLTAVGAVGLDAEAVDGLREHTEGWAVGLQLTALSLRGDVAPSAAAVAIRGDDRHILLVIDGRAAEAVPFADDAWRRAGRLQLPPLLALQAASVLAQALFDSGHLEDAGRLCAGTASAVREVERAWGDAPAPGIARLHLVRGRLAAQAGDVPTSLTCLRRAVSQSRTWANPSQLVTALTSLAGAELAGGDRAAARAALAEAREAADSDPLWPAVRRDLDAAEARIGRGAARAARRAGVLVEELTDRELSILRMLPGSASQREIGAAMFLSINTVKGYTKSLYRKLDVATRQDAVVRARDLGLI
jgi:ATP/maltotriose-dependent transcriptional regulator MalT